MNSRSKFILFVLLLCPTLWAQSGSSNGGGGILNWMYNIPDWLQRLIKLGDPPPPLNYTPGEVRWEWKCENGLFVIYGYYHTYPGVNGFDPNVGRTPTNIPCDPTESTDPNGAPAPNANSTAQPKNNMVNPPQGKPPTPVTGGVGPKTNQPGRAAITVSPAALNLTVPYRELGVIPFSPIKSIKPTVSCNTAANPTGYAVDHLDGSVTRYNLCTSQPLGTIAVVTHPLQVRVTPEGAQAIVTSYDNGITFIDTATNQVTKVLRPGIFASGLAISNDAAYALVTNYDDASPYLAVIDIASKTIAGKITLDRIFPQSVFLNPDNTLAWVTYPWDNAVEVIDILTGTVTQTINILNPFDVAFNPTGTNAFIASGGGTVLVVDTGTYKSIASVPAGAGACDLQVSPDGHVVTVNNYIGNSITIFDTRSLPFSVTIPGGRSPRGTAIVPIQ